MPIGDKGTGVGKEEAKCRAKGGNKHAAGGTASRLDL